jgi:6-phosphogluconolactonase
MTPEVIVDDLPGLRRRLASELEHRARVAIASRGNFTIALPGGSVAMEFFPVLATMAVDWSRTDFFWIDERAVPPDDPESNYALASRLWLTPASIPASRVHRMHGEDPDLERAAQMSAGELIRIAGNPPRLDVALVGVGEDGHVASVFPGRSASGTPLQHCPVIPVYDAPKPPSRRLTLTLPALSNAECVIVVARGSSKTAPIRNALKHITGEAPLTQLLRDARSSLVLLDSEAAGKAIT